MTLNDIQAAAEPHGLLVMGALHPRRVGAKGLLTGTIVLLGTGPGFWSGFKSAAEYRDGAADAVDRWSGRVIGNIADRFGADPVFPFGGPPYAPFIDWALKSGRSFSSPTGMLVHDTVGLMISFRGALHFDQELSLPAGRSVSPCHTCKGQPCTTACPVGALGATQPYDVSACHAYLATTAGRACMETGCAARRACPISAGAARCSDQSAYHMKAFHPR